MRKILTVGLVALVAACGSDKMEKPIQYGAPQAPTFTEQGAASSAQTTLQGSLAYQPSTQPATGVVGLGDQLVANLGGYAVSAKAPDASSAKVAQGAARQAFDTGGMDPACVGTEAVAGVTTVTWRNCQVDVADTDPVTGDTTTMHVTIDGWLRSSPATGQASWSIGETMAMTMTSGGDTITMNGTAGLGGSTTVTATTIVANTTSTVDVHATYMGMTINEAIETTLAADLGYQADPFCITSGTLTVEQRWNERPMGATAASLPNQGWQFVWSGCGAFEVRHGS